MSQSSTPSKKIHAPSDALREAHGLPKGKHISGHKVVIKGLYFAFDAKGEKVKRAYREEFELAPAAHLVHGQGALGAVLSDKILGEHLLAKDPEFRAVQTHEVEAHENLFVDAPAPDEEGIDDGDTENGEK